MDVHNPGLRFLVFLRHVCLVLLLKEPCKNGEGLKKKHFKGIGQKSCMCFNNKWACSRVTHEDNPGRSSKPWVSPQFLKFRCRRFFQKSQCLFESSPEDTLQIPRQGTVELVDTKQTNTNDAHAQNNTPFLDSVQQQSSGHRASLCRVSKPRLSLSFQRTKIWVQIENDPEKLTLKVFYVSRSVNKNPILWIRFELGQIQSARHTTLCTR